MWHLMAVAIFLVDVATSKTESLQDFKNLQNSIPIRLGNFVRRPEVDQRPEVGDFPDDFESLKKLSILEDLDDGADERISTSEDDDDTEIDQLSEYLSQLIQEPGGWEAPLVLVDEPIQFQDHFQDDGSAEAAISMPLKRSRYYRRYPWKRQNSRTYGYDDGSRYLCTPTREDVFQLLSALHNARLGDKSQMINFCNRRRPAGAVFTNIRFLGRRK